MTSTTRILKDFYKNQLDEFVDEATARANPEGMTRHTVTIEPMVDVIAAEEAAQTPEEPGA